MGIISGHANPKARELIREHMILPEGRHAGLSVSFVIGRPARPNATSNDTAVENATHGDLLLVSCWEGGGHLMPPVAACKTHLWYHTALALYPRTPWFMKSEDDAFVAWTRLQPVLVQAGDVIGHGERNAVSQSLTLLGSIAWASFNDSGVWDNTVRLWRPVSTGPIPPEAGICFTGWNLPILLRHLRKAPPKGGLPLPFIRSPTDINGAAAKGQVQCDPTLFPFAISVEVRSRGLAEQVDRCDYASQYMNATNEIVRRAQHNLTHRIAWPGADAATGHMVAQCISPSVPINLVDLTVARMARHEIEAHTVFVHPIKLRNTSDQEMVGHISGRWKACARATAGKVNSKVAAPLILSFSRQPEPGAGRGTVLLQHTNRAAKRSNQHWLPGF